MNSRIQSSERTVLRQRIESRIEDLPILPAVLMKLMALSRAAEDFPEQVLALIEVEPGYAARVLSVANSAASAPATPISSLRAAITRIGSARAVDLVTAAAVTRVFVPRDPWEKSIWRHSLQVAVAARALTLRADDRDLPPDEVYAAALLHDLGRLIMFSEAPDLLRRMDEGDWESPETLVLAERAICGVAHTELGAMACRQWDLPETIVIAVRDHHDSPIAVPRTRQAKIATLMRFADLAMFPSALPGTLGWAEASQALVGRVLVPKLPSFIKMTAADLHTLIRTAAAESEVMARALGFGDGVGIRA